LRPKLASFSESMKRQAELNDCPPCQRTWHLVAGWTRSRRSYGP
jgi:hypothetical protein